ncbi:hypothetical protein H1Q58_13595 [Planococcus maritimus]|uniref:Uncharacterized protein n=1 Tax=Planococcus maritimus TaxID=192421 RepID=A0A7D7MG96_PLAMR|nr:hypothetical protein [Planococcus maritimus]QMT16991.1 hypothetical protein H1Q58_13595 [Planococcus maritimus]
MKQTALGMWILVALALGFTDKVSWPFVAALSLVPVFFIGQPWYRHLLKKSDEL